MNSIDYDIKAMKMLIDEMKETIDNQNEKIKDLKKENKILKDDITKTIIANYKIDEAHNYFLNRINWWTNHNIQKIGVHNVINLLGELEEIICGENYQTIKTDLKENE